jgi:hypothetical protein
MAANPLHWPTKGEARQVIYVTMRLFDDHLILQSVLLASSQ